MLRGWEKIETCLIFHGFCQDFQISPPPTTSGCRFGRGRNLKRWQKTEKASKRSIFSQPLKHAILGAVLFSMFVSSDIFAEKLVWSGQVSTDGSPTKAIDLTPNKKYQITISGVVNLGKWVQGGNELADDAFYEFNSPSGVSKSTTTFRNSGDIPLDENTYHPDHVYKTKPFVAKLDKIHFWVSDFDYSDNSGAFEVTLVELD